MLRALVVILLFAIIPAAGHAVACHHDACFSYSELHAYPTPVALLVCPAGDTPTFIEQGFWITITTIECGGGGPAGYIPASDYWIIDDNPSTLPLCGGVLSSNADSASGADGVTTMSNTTLVAGGCSDGIVVVAQGLVLEDSSQGCLVPEFEAVYVRSPDLDGSLTVDIVDLSIFASHFPPNAYETCCDFDLSGAVGLQDLATFAQHFPAHTCSP